MQFTFAFLLPTALLVALQRRRSTYAAPSLDAAAQPGGSRASPEAEAAPDPVLMGPEEPLWAACFVASQLLWLALRVLLDAAEAE